ncbi:hypothetical protein ACQWKP_23645, partial [Salmonella enterica subsp. enterica serovar Infantis]
QSRLFFLPTHWKPQQTPKHPTTPPDKQKAKQKTTTSKQKNPINQKNQKTIPPGKRQQTHAPHTMKEKARDIVQAREEKPTT